MFLYSSKTATNPIGFFALPEELKIQIVLEFWFNAYRDGYIQLLHKRKEHENICIENNKIRTKSNNLRIHLSEIKGKTFSHSYEHKIATSITAIEDKLEKLSEKAATAMSNMHWVIQELVDVRRNMMYIKNKIASISATCGDYTNWKARVERMDVEFVCDLTCYED
jgi:hypothetical protein